MNKNKKILIIFLLVLISIGFAYLTSTLEINGITGIGRNTWNIYFDNVVNLSGANLATTAPTTSGTNTKSISYSVNLNKPGDVYRFNVDIVNGGTLDAMITVLTNTTLTAEQEKYVEYSVTYADETPLATTNKLAKNTRDKLLVSVIYKDNISNEEILSEDINIDIDLSIKYEQADSTAQARTTGQLNVKFDYNNNLFPELEDCALQTGSRAKLSINNGVVEVTSLLNDGYYYMGNVDLVNGSKYYFTYEIDSQYASNSDGTIDSQEILFIRSSTFYTMYKRENYFTATQTNNYGIRYDVNMQDKVHRFWNFLLTEYVESNFNVGANLVLPTAPTRSGYTFSGWYTERVGGTKITTSTKVNYSTTYYAHWLEA